MSDDRTTPAEPVTYSDRDADIINRAKAEVTRRIQALGKPPTAAEMQAALDAVDPGVFSVTTTPDDGLFVTVTVPHRVRCLATFKRVEGPPVWTAVTEEGPLRCSTGASIGGMYGTVTIGNDGRVFTGYDDQNEGEDLTRPEREALAEFMIARWRKWAAEGPPSCD